MTSLPGWLVGSLVSARVAGGGVVGRDWFLPLPDSPRLALFRHLHHLRHVSLLECLEVGTFTHDKLVALSVERPESVNCEVATTLRS